MIIRSIEVCVEIDTDEGTYSKTFHCGEDETLTELMERVTEWAEAQVE